MVYNKRRNTFLYEDIFFVSESSTFLFSEISMQKNLISTIVCFGVEKSNQKQQKLASIFLSFLTTSKPICKVWTSKFSKNSNKKVKHKIDFQVVFSNVVYMYNQLYIFFSSEAFVFHKFIIKRVLFMVYLRKLSLYRQYMDEKYSFSRTSFMLTVKNMFIVKKFRYFVDLTSFMSTFSVNLSFKVRI